MSKTTISILVVALVVVGGYFIVKAKKAESPEVANMETNTQSTPKKMAFSEFIKQGGAYKCDVKQSMSDMENSGTVYIDGTMISGEYSTIAEGRKMDTNFILKDGYSYTWSSTLPGMGFKIKIPESANDNVDASASGDYSWNANQIGDYNCEPWMHKDKYTKFIMML
jgi:hypothetical protein